MTCMLQFENTLNLSKMIIDDVMDEVDYMEDLATEYLIYLDGDQTEEMLYKIL